MWFFCDLVKHNKFVYSLFILIIDWSLKTLRLPFLNTVVIDKALLHYSFEHKILCSSIHLLLLDYFIFYIVAFNLSTRSYCTNKLQNAKLTQLNNKNFYLFSNTTNLFSFNQLFLYGLRSIWKHFRLWLLPLSFSFLFVYYSFFLKSLPFSKVFFSYLLIGNMFYLLFSGFVFFIKKYQYRLFTSAIQRFWRRTLIIFWAIEGSLFIVFVYFIFNASQEPINVYDNIQIYKTHFYSWRFFLVKVILSTLLIVLTYMLLLSLKWNTFSKTNNISFFYYNNFVLYSLVRVLPIISFNELLR